MSRVGSLLPILFGVALCWLLSGAWSQRAVGPQLVQVSELAPREVEVGDRLTIVGDGFPPGRSARVTFRGTLHRPGERPDHDAEIVAGGVVSGPQRVEVAVTTPMQSLFCRAGDRTAHTTFEGDVEVAFAAALAGAPPVAGILQHVTLDLRPTRPDVDRERQGARLLEWIGATATASASGLVVKEVRSGSAAAGAGLAPGDAIVAFDGVRVASVGDALPAPGEREATLTVRRDGVEADRVLGVDGFRYGAPTELFGASLIVFVALALILLVGAPARSGLATTLQRAASRLRRGKPLAATLAEALPPRGPFGAVDALAFALLAALPFGQYLVAAQLDVGLLFTLAATSLATAALVAHGSAWAGVRAAAAVAWQHAPAALAVVAVVTVTGSLRIREIEGAQGGWPWDWLAFRNPGALVALVVLLECGRIDPGGLERPSGLAGLVEEGAPQPRSRPWLDAACRAHRVLVAGLASALFLGGWLLPGLTHAAQDARPLLELAGAVWFLGKTAGLVVLLAWSRVAFPRPRLGESARATALWLVPASLAALLMAAAWTWWSPTHAAQLLASCALVVAAALVAAAAAHRIRYGVTSPTGDGHVSPFL